MKQVSRKEFDDYIKNYPGELNTHFLGFVSPPILEYYSNGTLVAYTNYWDCVDEDGLRYHGWLDLKEENRRYCIKEPGN